MGQQRPDLRNHLSLTDRETLMEHANISRKTKAAYGTLYAEADLLDNDALRNWLDKQLLLTGSVEGWKTEQQIKAMHGDRPPRDAAAVYLPGATPVEPQKGSRYGRKR